MDYVMVSESSGELVASLVVRSAMVSGTGIRITFCYGNKKPALGGRRSCGIVIRATGGIIEA